MSSNEAGISATAPSRTDQPVNPNATGGEVDANSAAVQMPESIDEFKEFLFKAQEARRRIVISCLNNAVPEEELIQNIQDALAQLTDENTSSYEREVVVGKGLKFLLNVKDEITGLKKDVRFLEALTKVIDADRVSSLADSLRHVDLESILAPFHPISAEKFVEECDGCYEFLRRYVNSVAESGKKPILITDWDGTMKDYCSQYATNLQPIYSAIGIARFAATFTRLAAVLTAGPLKGPGILELTSLPIDGPIVFSGSWGREWWLNGKRIVHDHDISEACVDALSRFRQEMNEVLKEKEYSQFELVGSGVQQKVDRLTFGVQTVFHFVDADLSEKYQEQIKERMHRVDPDEATLHFDPSTELEVEVVAHNDGTRWTKSDGVATIIETMKDSLEPPSRVLICGDTASDLPMVSYATEKNPEGSMALFVTMKEDLKKRVREIVGSDDRVCFVSCPDVIHAAMNRVVKDHQLLAN